MKNKFKFLLLSAALLSAATGTVAQNVSLNMIVLNAGVVPVSGNGTLQATINATPGTGGQTNAVAAGKINLQISVPSTLLISTTQNNIPAGWTIRNNNGSVINLCNNASTVAVNTAVNILLDLEGVSSTTGNPTISGQLSFRTNCTAPGSLAGDNPSDNTGVAGFIVTGTVPVKLTGFSATMINCKPYISWTTENEVDFDRFEIEKSGDDSFNWITTGAVTASGNLLSKNKYNFQDNDGSIAAKKIFYRLKMIDKNGRFSFSQILPVSVNCGLTEINIFPNPVVNKKLYVSISGSNQKTTGVLFSMQGQVLANIVLKDGSNQIDLPDISTGEYILHVTSDNNTKTFKILVSN
jgi:Secretion system C-terminal sorting domain